MTDLTKRRQFSSQLQDVNRPYLPANRPVEQPTQVGFVLLEHFSMMAFTAAVDALVTSNLVQTVPLFSFSTYGLSSTNIVSDLGIEISASGTIDLLSQNVLDKTDILIICGGYRCSLDESKPLTSCLKHAASHTTYLGGLWNGAIPLAYAGLLDDRNCALHPENHAFFREQFKKVSISDQVIALDANCATSSGPSSALEMMFELIEKIQGKSIVRAVKEILSSDHIRENGVQERSRIIDDPTLPENLRSLLQLMTANIEEPLGLDKLANLANISRRQIERLFQTHLETSPSRYYLELRITHARQLLLQSNDSITNISVACGFLSPTHFSHCYKDFFGIPPSQARIKKR